MKKLAAILCLSALTTGAFAQGLVNFFNNASSLVSSSETGSQVAINGAAGSWYFGLLTSSSASGPFTFTGLYATNQTVAGRFFGGAGQAVTGWAAGATMSYEIAGWSSSLGHDFQAGWLTGNFGAGTGVFGLSSVATGQAGGATGTGTLPNYNLFGGTTGIQNGFNLAPVTTVPEPTSMALAGLGAAALLIFRRRK